MKKNESKQISIIIFYHQIYLGVRWNTVIRLLNSIKTDVICSRNGLTENIYYSLTTECYANKNLSVLEWLGAVI